MLFWFCLATFSAVAHAAAPYCLPGDACFPSKHALAALNATVGGRLIKSMPYGVVCYRDTYDADKCNTLIQNKSNADFRLTLPDSLMYSNWEVTHDGVGCPVPDDFVQTPVNGTCTYGNLAPYIIDATSSSDIVAGLKFAARYNLRLRVKNTGHDFAGRSSAEGSFTIRTHNLQKTSFTRTFVPYGCAAKTRSEPALMAEAGVNVHQLYTAAFNLNRTTIGGMSPSVGAAGGYVIGGGTGAFSHQHGLAVDNALQFEVVTTDGVMRLANRCQNPDLFWALRGGGGAFGVTTRVWLKSYPPLKATNSIFGGLVANSTDSYNTLIRTFVDLLPALFDQGITGEWTSSFPQLGMILQRHFTENDTVAPATDTLSALDAALAIPGVSNLLGADQFTTWLESYEKTIIPTIEPNAPVGANMLLASRIVSDALVQSSNGRRAIADYIINLPPGTTIIFQMLAGGKINSVGVHETAVHPAWRTSFGFMDLIVPSPTFGTTSAQRAKLEVLRKRADKTIGKAAYYNENSPHIGWQDTQWGSNYPRLLKIKKQLDPNGVLSCRACVGSEVFGH